MEKPLALNSTSLASREEEESSSIQHVILVATSFLAIPKARRFSWFLARVLNIQEDTDQSGDEVLVAGVFQDGKRPWTNFLPLLTNPVFQVRFQKNEDDLESPSGAEVMEDLPQTSWSPSISNRGYTIYLKYKFCIALDISPSIASLSHNCDFSGSCDFSENILYSRVIGALEMILRGLVEPFKFGTGGIKFQPEISISILAQGAISPAFMLLVQGFILNPENVDVLLYYCQLKTQEVFKHFRALYDKASKEEINFSSNLVTLIQHSLFNTKLLDANAVPHVVLVTDGITYLPSECNRFDELLMSLNREGITISCVCLKRENRVDTCLGYIPDFDALEVLTSATQGLFLRFPPHNHKTTAAHETKNIFSNPLHALLLTPTSACTEPMPRSLPANSPQLAFLTHMQATSHPYPYDPTPPPAPVLVQTVFRKSRPDELNLPWSLLVHRRIKEGWVLETVISRENATEIFEIHFRLKWQTNVYLRYKLSISGHAAVQWEIEIIAFYEFLHIFTSLYKYKQQGPSGNSGPVRFQHFLEELVQGDKIAQELLLRTKAIEWPLWAASAQTLGNVSPMMGNSHSVSFGPRGGLQGLDSTSPASEAVLYRSGAKMQTILKFLENLPSNSWHRYFELCKIELIAKEPGIPAREHEVVSNVKPELYHKYNTLSLPVICNRWGQAIGKRFWIKFLDDENSEKHETRPFALLKLHWETTKMVVAHFAFFQASLSLIDKTVKDFQKHCELRDNKEKNYLTSPTRSIRSLLIRYEPGQTTKQTFQPSSIKKMPPLSPFLSHYMFYKKKIFDFCFGDSFSEEFGQTRALIRENLVDLRTRECFSLVNSQNSLTFLKEIPIVIKGERESYEVPISVQYLLYEIDQYMVTEIWMEPQCGFSPKNSKMNHNAVFEEICTTIFDKDSEVIDAIYTFDWLKLFIQRAQLASDDHDPEVHRPRFSLSKINLSKTLTQDFYHFPEQLERENALLFSCLKATFAFHSDCEIPIEIMKDILPLSCMGQGNVLCFGKVISNSSVIISFLPRDTFCVYFIECSKPGLLRITAEDCGEVPKPEQPERQSYAKKVYYDALNLTHARNMSRVLYTCVRDNSAFPESDISKALETCTEFVQTVDLTQFVGLSQAVESQDWKHFRVENQQSQIAIKHEFEKLCGVDFKQIPNTQYFAYSPPVAGAECERSKNLPNALLSSVNDSAEDLPAPFETLKESEEEEDKAGDFWPDDDLLFLGGKNWRKEDLASLVFDFCKKSYFETFPFPFFVRIECCVIPAPKPEATKDETAKEGASSSEEQSKAIVIPITSFPTWKDDLAPFGETFASVSLRVHYLTFVGKGISTTMPPLREIRRVISKKTNEIQGILARYTLELLRVVRPLTTDLIELAVRLMEKLRVEPTVQPLTFYDVRRAKNIFSEELLKAKSLGLQKADNYYYLIGGLNITQISDSTENQSPLVQSLQKEAEIRQTVEEEMQPVLQKLFWFILTYETDTAKCYLYSRYLTSQDKQLVAGMLTTRIKAVTDRTNRLILLNQLQETRICPAELSCKRHTLLESTDQVPQSVFSPDYFACPRVEKLRFPLHPRVLPAKAIAALINSTFNPFFIQNRKNLFVFRQENGSVFYMELCDSMSKRRREEGLLTPSPSYLSLSRSTSMSDMVSSPSFENLKLSKDPPFLFLKVFGVDPPGPEITIHFYNLLRSRLSSIVLSVLSGLFERNPRLKFTKEDIEFLRGNSKKPRSSQQLMVPAIVSAEKFLQYFVQNLEQFLLPMFTSDLPEEYLECDTSTTVISVNLIYNFSSVNAGPVNQPKRTPQFFESLGKGMAIVRIELENGVSMTPPILESQWNAMCGVAPKSPMPSTRQRDRETKNLGGDSPSVMLRSSSNPHLTQLEPTVRPRSHSNPEENANNPPNTNSPENSKGSSELGVASAASTNTTEDSANHSSYVTFKSENPENFFIRIKIWAPDSFESTDKLQEAVALSLRQTKIEYALDHYFLQRFHPEEINDLRKIFDQGLTHSTPTLKKCSIPISLPSWSLPNFINEVTSLLIQLNPGLDPIQIYIATDGTKYDRITADSVPAFSQLFFAKDRYRVVFAGGNPPRELLASTTCSPSKRREANVGNSNAQVSSHLPTSSPSLSLASTLHSPPQPFSPSAAVSSTAVVMPQNSPARTSWGQDHMLHPQIKTDNFSLVRSCFALLVAGSSGFVLYAYNWKNGIIENFQMMLNKIKSWSTIRQHLLRGILTQKMGLFYHLSPLTPVRGSAADTVKFTMDTIDLPIMNSAPNTQSTFRKANSESLNATDSNTNNNNNNNNNQQISHILEFSSVLQEARPKIPLHKSEFVKQHSDPITQHGIQFKQVAEGFAEEKQRRNIIQNVHSIWAGLSQFSAKSKLEYEHINILARSSRLIYCARLPFFLQKSAATTKAESLAPILSFVNTSEQEFEAFEKHQLSAFLAYAGQSLIDLGFQQVRLAQTSLLQKQGKSECVFQITFYGGFFLLKVGYSSKSGFAYMDVHALHTHRSAQSMSFKAFRDTHKNRGNLILFVQEGLALKQQLNLQRLLYHFHIENICRFLAQENTVPYPPARIVELLQCMSQHKPPPDAANRIFSGRFVLDYVFQQHSVMPLELIHYISTNAAKYGLQSLKGVGITPGFCVASSSWKFFQNNTVVQNNKEASSDEESDTHAVHATYWLVAFLARERLDEESSPHFTQSSFGPTKPLSSNWKPSLNLLYYVLRRDPEAEKKQGPNSLQVLSPSELEIAAQSEKLFGAVIDLAGTHYQRDIICRRLATVGPSAKLAKVTNPMFYSFCDLVYTRSVSEVDPRLAKLIGQQPYLSHNGLLIHLMTCYEKKTFFHKQENSSHLVIFYSSDLDLFFRVQTDDAKSLQIYVCRREESISAKQLALERTGTAEFVNHIIFFFWRSLYPK